MGRNTYDFVYNYGSWPYEDKPTWVYTKRDLEPLKGPNLIVVGEIEDVVSGAAQQGIEHLWLVSGGRLGYCKVVIKAQMRYTTRGMLAQSFPARWLTRFRP